MYRVPAEKSMWRLDGTRKQFFVYILSNTSMRMYTGVTNSLVRRFGQHVRGECVFTKRYHFDRVVYYETYDLAVNAIAREKMIKNMHRDRKIALVKTINPMWRNLLGE